MNIEEFKNSVDLYSADLSRWPMESVKKALALIEQNADAKSYFDAALELDSALRACLPAPACDMALLEDRIMAAIAQTPQTHDHLRTDIPEDAPVAHAVVAQAWGVRALFVPGGGLLAVAILGFFLGFAPSTQAEGILDPAYFLQLQSADADIDEGDIF